MDAPADEMVGLARSCDPAWVSGGDANVIADAARVIARAASSIEACAVAGAAASAAWQQSGPRPAEDESLHGLKKRAAKATPAVSGEEERALTSLHWTAYTAEVAST